MTAVRQIWRPYERFRGGTLFKEHWPEKKAAQVAFFTGRGLTSSAIAKIIGDGTHPATIRAMWKKWALPYNGRSADLIVPMSQETERLLAMRAAAEGITPAEWCAKVLGFAAQYDLFDAVVPDAARCKKPGRLKPQ